MAPPPPSQNYGPGTPGYNPAHPLMRPPPAHHSSSVGQPGEPEKLPPQPGQEEYYRRPDNWPGRGYLVRYVGEAIHRAQNTPLNIRHDVLIERRVIGRLLGKGGRDLEAMQLCSGAEIFIIDKYPPPGEGDDHRLCVLIGKPESIRIAIDKVNAILARAREELPPLPPPLTSGWRPVPSVGAAEEEGGQGWVTVDNSGGREGAPKRAREEDGYPDPRNDPDYGVDDRDFGPPKQPSEQGGGGGGYGPPPGPGLRPPPPPGQFANGHGPPPPPPGGPRGYGAPPSHPHPEENYRAHERPRDQPYPGTMTAYDR